MTTLLRTVDLRREFGELVAVDGVSLDVVHGEITCIIGPNGAGKTTFYDLLTGMVEPTSGEVWLRHDGELQEITGLPAHEIADRGLARSFQIIEIFERLTVRQNVQVACVARNDRTLDLTTWLDADEAINEQVDEILELTGLTHLAEKRCSTLSYGQQRNVEISLALAIESSVVLLDEPTAGLNPTDSAIVVDFVNELDERTDTTFVVTEHDMDVVFNIADRIVVLHDGRVIADGDPGTVRADETVTEAYLGGSSI